MPAMSRTSIAWMRRTTRVIAVLHLTGAVIAEAIGVDAAGEVDAAALVVAEVVRGAAGEVDAAVAVARVAGMAAVDTTEAEEEGSSFFLATDSHGFSRMS